MGAAVDISVAWLAQKKAKIEAQTQSFTLVENSIAKAAASVAGADPQIGQRAMDVLIRKEYRKQINRDAVGAAMIDDLRSEPENSQENQAQKAQSPVIDDDWLNVFERYAEDASSERMQKLWGRVLAGEVRRPGRFSMRTLRFLSEFSQADALSFSNFCELAFGDAAPASLVNPPGKSDIRDLIYMESAGLLQGATGLGLQRRLVFDQAGNAFIKEGQLLIMLKGDPNTEFQEQIVALTPMGQELIALLPDRDARAAARRVALSMRSPQLKSAYIATFSEVGQVYPMEVLWQEETAISPTK